MKSIYIRHSKKYAVLVSIFMIISLTFILSGCEDYTSQYHVVNSNPINSVNTGFIVQSEDGTIYFQDGKKNNNITQWSESGKVIFDDTYGMCLSIYDKYLYYRNFGKGSQLMRLEIVNPDNREIISDMNTCQTIIVDDMIYANIVDMKSNNKDGLYRISLDGTKKKRLVDAGINCMQYESDYIYYAVQLKGQLFRMDLNGKNKEEILWKETGEYVKTTHFIVNNGWIYFNNSNRNGDAKGVGAVDSTLSLCRIRTDGTEYEELVTGFVLNIYSNSNEDYLLFINEDSLYAMNLDTGEIKQILNEEIDWVNVIGDIVYALDWRTENKDSVIYRIDMQNNETTILGEEY
ncbi:MAG: DUF5050 domain-containing protein [Clostridia bacterium]|nr:DUF5050 domain-containing protein [Clostridia bacterium]